MPLEISEIGVRLVVGGAAAPMVVGGSPVPKGAPQSATPSLSPEHFDELVAACTQQVLAALKADEAR